MRTIPVVENPRKRKKGRKGYSAAQLAAGFGGKRGMSRRARRRNPMMLSSLAANPSRRRKRSYRRYRNPSGFSGSRIMSQVMSGVSVAAGIFAANQAPNLVKRFVPQVPGGVFVDSGIKLLVGIAGGMLLKRFAGARFAENFTAGAVGVAVYDLANHFVLTPMGLGDYMNTPTYIPSLSGYQSIPAPGMSGMGQTVSEMAV